LNAKRIENEPKERKTKNPKKGGGHSQGQSPRTPIKTLVLE